MILRELGQSFAILGDFARFYTILGDLSNIVSRTAQGKRRYYVIKIVLKNAQN